MWLGYVGRIRKGQGSWQGVGSMVGQFHKRCHRNMDMIGIVYWFGWAQMESDSRYIVSAESCLYSNHTPHRDLAFCLS